MGLYYAMLHIWVRVFGYTDVSVRAMGVLLGGLAVPTVAILGGRLLGRASGLAAGLLLAVAPFFVHYEQTARSYALLVTLVALSSYLFAVGIERPSTRTRVGYVLASAAAVYAHYAAAFVLVVQALTLLAVKRRAAFCRGWLMSGISLALLCVPEFVFAGRAGTGQLAWIPQPSFRTVVHLPVDLAGGTVIACVLIVLACYGLARLTTEGRRWQAGFLAAWCVGPVLLDLAISWLGQPLFLSYYLIVLLPAWLLLAGAGAVRLPSSVIRGAFLVLVVALLLVGLANWYRAASAENYRAATGYLLRHARPADAVFYDPSFADYGVVHYEALANTTAPRALRALPAAPSTGGPPRIWLVFRDFDVPPAQQMQVERSLAGGYEKTGYSRTFSDLSVILYRKR
jgi:mannosyltransferase